MRPATASRLARLVPALLAVGFVLTACVTTAAPGWTFEPPPKTSAPASAGASVAPSGGSAAPSGSPSVAPPASASGAPSGSASVAPSGSAPASPSASGPASPSASPSGGSAEDQVKLAATNTAFDKSDIEAKAGQPFQIVFVNNDSGIPHNVQIKAPDGSEPFKGSLLTGPGTVTYDVPALTAGAYVFHCIVHPSMTGTLTVK